MRFINRSAELQYLKEAAQLSRKKLFSLSVSGLRRVGKTRLILELLRDRDVYLFVNKNKESHSLILEYEAVLKEKKVLAELESLKTWDDFFDILLKRFKGIVAFDEFQNFASVDDSVFGILQKQLDLNEEREGILFIFSGSTVGLMKKFFSDKKEPLYGRLKRKINLQPLSFKGCIEMCTELGIKSIGEMIELYTIFGGYPKYYVAMEDENLFGESTMGVLDRFFFQENAALEEEINQILSLEFGKRSGIYYGILTAIANGNTRFSEIASFLGKKETNLTRQMNELTDYFELVGVERPLVSGRNLFYIKHPLMKFWFRFFYKNLSSYKRREPWLLEKIKSEINPFIGKGFEVVCREFISENSPFKLQKIGRQWGKIPGAPRDKNQYEIDMVALNEKTREILFGECKWKKNVNAEKVLSELKEKAKIVDWNVGQRKAYYAVFARSFQRRPKGENVLLFDLHDLERGLR